MSIQLERGMRIKLGDHLGIVEDVATPGQLRAMRGYTGGDDGQLSRTLRAYEVTRLAFLAFDDYPESGSLPVLEYGDCWWSVDKQPLDIEAA